MLADESRKTFRYVYGFGDCWSHTINQEKVVPTVAGAPNIMLLNAVGRWPPEDCGGAPAYESLLDILNDPAHDEHEAMVR